MERRITNEELMKFLDQELAPEERARIERELQVLLHYSVLFVGIALPIGECMALNQGDSHHCLRFRRWLVAMSTRAVNWSVGMS